MAGLKLYLLGSPRVELDHKNIEIESRKGLALLAYLAVTGDNHNRDALSTLLWPEYDQSRARSYLRHALWVLKKTLGETWLDISRKQVGLNPIAGIWLDVSEFQQQAATAAEYRHSADEFCITYLEPLTVAVSLYRDDFLAGFTLPDAPDFDEWQFFQTEGLRQSLGQILGQLITGYQAGGKFEQAIPYARRWLALDPLHEPAQRQLIQLYDQSGQLAAALRQYEQFVKLMGEELGIPPEEETTTLYEAIKAKRVLSPFIKSEEQKSKRVEEKKAGTSPSPPLGREIDVDLLERDQFLKELAVILEDVAKGNGHTLLVSGEAGIGKTTLIERFTQQSWDKARILWGGCEALFTPRPLGPLHDIAHQTQNGLLSLLDEGADRTVIFSSFLDELQGATQPTIVVFEDVHWADEATLDLIKFLGRRIHQTNSMLILSYRNDEVDAHHPLRFVIGDLPSTTTTRLSLPPLSEAAVTTLAQKASRSAEGLYAATDGNPFFVTEVLANENSGVPITVRDAVLARAARLSPATRDMLELASVVPARIEQWLLDAILSPPSTLLEECLEAGMLRLDNHGLSFRHELARRAVEDSLTAPRLRTLHKQILEALMKRDTGQVEVSRLVHHATHTGDGSAVLQFAPAAARKAAALGAHREAVSHYETTLRYGHMLGLAKRAGLLEDHAYECYLTSQIEEAVQSRQTALDIWRRLGDRSKEGHNLRWLSRLNWFLSKRPEAEHYAAQAVNLLETLPPDSELAMAYSNRAQLYMLADETVEAVRWGTQAIELAEKLNDIETLAHALNNVGTAELHDKYDNTGRSKLEQSLELSLGHKLHEHAARAYTNLASRAVVNRDYARAANYLNDGITYCTERDLDAWSLYMTGWQARAKLEQGDWVDAVNDARAVIDSYQVPPVTKISALVVLGLVQVRRGDLGGAEPLLDEALDLAMSTAEIQRIAPVTAARAEAAWLKGELEQGLAEARVGFDLASKSSEVWALGELSFWMWRAGELSEPPDENTTPFALQIAGDWRAAAVAWEKIGCPYEQAVALADGDEEAQRAALPIFEGLGAGPMAEIVRQKLQTI